MDVVLAVQQYVARMTEGVSGMKALLLDKEVFEYVNTYMPTVWHVMLCCARRAPGEMFPNGENLGLCIVDACSLAHAHKLTHIYAHAHTLVHLHTYNTLLKHTQTTAMVSMVISRSQVLEKEVFLFQRIDAQGRGQMLHLKAIVFLRPTRDNIELLAKELMSPLFGTLSCARARVSRACPRTRSFSSYP